MSRLKILSFDGGGIRGALCVRILNRLNKIFPDLIDKTDLVAGTSTGSFIALSLADQITIDTLEEFYSIEKTKYIFEQKSLGVFRPKYDNRHLKEMLNNLFPDCARLKNLSKKVVIPSFKLNERSFYSINQWKPIFFNNFCDSKSKNFTVLDVALASSAAPVYFPSYKECIDGGLIANNPSTIAISFAVKYMANINNISLLSLGTGYVPEGINRNTTNWGAVDWVVNFSPTFPLFKIMNEGTVSAYKITSQNLLGKKYFRFNPTLPKKIELDDYKKIPYIKKYADKLNLKPIIKWLQTNWTK